MGRGRSKINGRYNEYKSTGEVLGGIKVIESIKSPRDPLPRFSGSPNAVYILKSHGYYKSIGIYGENRELKKEIDISHGHVNRPKSGKKESLKKGVAHVHNIYGGRENNVRYMTKKEIKKYGKAVIAMGGKTYE